MTEIIEQGHFGAHLRRMCAQYRAARDTLVADRRAKVGGHLDVEAPEQGMHLVAKLRYGLDDRAVARAGLAHGVDRLAAALSGCGPGERAAES